MVFYTKVVYRNLSFSYQRVNNCVLHKGKIGLLLVKVDHHAKNVYGSQKYRYASHLHFLCETYFDVVKI
jgi:hypothetical protein